MWRNWALPVINPAQSSDEESYNSVESQESDPNLLVSPRRPPQSPSVSPRALLQPDPIPTEEVLAEAGSRLRDLPDRRRRAEARAAAAAAAEVNAGVGGDLGGAVMPDPPAIVNFEEEDGVDDAKALQDACKQLERFNWDCNDLPFTFNQLEIKMAANGVRK